MQSRKLPAWSLIAVTSIVLSTSCIHADLPPEAYGIFVDTNNRAFNNTLEVGASSITLFVGVALMGKTQAPIACRGEAPLRVSAAMSLELVCQGERIPYTFAYRSTSGDWVVTEDKYAPQIFKRR